MATPSICRTCARTFRSSRTTLQPLLSAPRTRHMHIKAPLYLDFLAPSWRRSSTTTSTPFLPQQTTRIQSRPFTHSTPNHSQPTSNTTAITNPRNDDEGNPRTIHITPRAAHRLKKIATTDENPNLALRVSVESGGCHGFQYLMSLINVREDVDGAEDTVFELGGEEGEGYKAKVVMDEASLELLSGSSIDYSMELIGSQFKVVGIPGAKSSCGCGTSFDIA